MKPSVCKCCGEPISGEEAVDSRNPNVCFSCASLLDDLQDNTILESAIPVETPAATPDEAETTTPAGPADTPTSNTEPALPKKKKL